VKGFRESGARMRELTAALRLGPIYAKRARLELRKAARARRLERATHGQR